MSLGHLKEDKKQEISLKFKIEKQLDSFTYNFYVNSKYTNENNISFEYNALYDGVVNNGDTLNIDENLAKDLLLDIENSIINNIKNLNPIIDKKEKETKIDYLQYYIRLLFNESKNVYPKLNLENIFNSIISILKDRNIELENKSLDDLIKERKITISKGNQTRFYMDIIKNKYDDYDLKTIIYYNDRVSETLGYNVKLSIEIGKVNKVEINKFSDYSDYYRIFDNYNYYLEFIEILKPDKFLDLIINPVILNETKKTINEYGFHDALKSIDMLVNKDAIVINEIKSSIIGEIFKNIINYFNLKNKIKC